ncbi:GOLPH3/VPS74 family protein [Arthrobacter halodurans]|uniref:GPP34 family phosphoprotein n=1 Tax=Arthrobacter halodurans TaxID=516699 RepID=A0ABV4UM44_9MICC
MNPGPAGSEPDDAPTDGTDRLSLPEEFLLLALRDADGRRQLSRSVLKVGLAGAKLAELAALGAVELRGRNVVATGLATATSLDHELELIRDKSRPHTAQHWVSHFESGRELHRVLESLAQKGIVDHVGARAFGVVPVTRYPERNHDYEAGVLQRIRDALAGGAADARTAALVGLLDATGLLPRLVGKDADPAALKQLTHHQWPAHAVAAELGAIAYAEEEART